MAYLTDDLLLDIKRDSFMPTVQGSFTDAEILAIADGELTSNICPLLVSMDENWFVEFTDGTFTANVADYTLPQYAMWLKLKRVDRINAGQYQTLIRIDIPDLRFYNTTNNGTPSAFYLKHDVISFYPTPASGITDTYRIHLYRRPNRMVKTSLAAQVQSVNLGTGQVTYTAVPPATYTATSFHDFFKGLSPFRRIVTNAQASNILGAVQTFAVGDVQNLAAGDWVCIHDETVYPAIPIELHEFLKDLVISSLNRTQSDYENYQIQKQEIMERIKAAMLAPGARIISQGKKLALYQHGLLGRGRGFRY